jgi:hypothetical protein
MKKTYLKRPNLRNNLFSPDLKFLFPLHPIDFLLYSAPMTPERELWGHVLLQAICDVVGLHVAASAHDRRLIRQQAETWFLAHSSSLGSFRWVCNSLGLDPATVRRHAFTLSVGQLRQRTQNTPAIALTPPPRIPDNGTDPQNTEASPGYT